MPLYLEQLETPAAVVDLDRLAMNLDRMAAYAAVHGLRLRPHVKTHKSARIGAEQMRLGAVGLTCATVREAEVMSELTDDLLLAFPIIGTTRLRRLMNLPQSVRLTVMLDSARTAVQLAAAADEVGREIHVLVEQDVGMRRTGVQGAAAAVQLAEFVADRAPLRYDGLGFYPGHIRTAIGDQQPQLAALTRTLAETIDALTAKDLAPRVVSGGSTPAAWRMHEVPGITEVRPGTYVYNDRATAVLGACEWDECALSVVATVVSTSVSGQAVIDAGTKALGREPIDAGRAPDADASMTAGYGALHDRPEVTVMRMSEEHGVLDLSRTDWQPKVGDLVRVVPNHVCIVVHLNDVLYGVRGDDVVETKWPVAARGREAPEGVPAW
jgi:D-serine deaminase-like pyridoxal phosphate-dependent protein